MTAFYIMSNVANIFSIIIVKEFIKEFIFKLKEPINLLYF